MSQTAHCTLAAAQLDFTLKEKESNLDKSLSALAEAASHGAQLVVFPECALTGYIYADMEELLPFAEPIPGPATDRLANGCRETGAYAVFGMVERDGDSAYNAVVLVGPEEGLIGSYRKVHLPMLGMDRFLPSGNRPFQVHDTALGRVGMLICYDLRFPEAARSLALQGADLLVLPTNWPVTSTTTADLLVRTRAYENRMFVVACDRVGVERDAAFLGRSQIVDPSGAVLAEAGTVNEEIIYSQVELPMARDKRVSVAEGAWIDVMNDRHPELYGEVVRPRT